MVDRDEQGTAEHGTAKRRRIKGGTSRRERVTTACDQCRQRKDKCDGQKPVCAPCQTHQRTCQYSPSKRRGLQTGYVRDMEMLLGILQATVEGSEDLLVALLGGGEVSHFNVRLKFPTGLPDHAASHAIESWRNSATMEHIEGLLDAGVPDTDEGGSTQALTRAIDASYEKLAKAHMDGIGEQATKSPVSVIPIQASVDLPTLPTPVDSTIIDHAPILPTVDSVPTYQDHGIDTVPSYEDLGEAYRLQLPTAASEHPTPVPAPALPPNWAELLNIYFASTHCWLPLCQKHDLLRSAYQLDSSSFVPPQLSLGTGDHAFLWAALAYASHVAAAQGITITQSTDPQTLASAAEGPLPPEPTAVPELGHVRALVLIALLHTDHGRFATAWLHICRAVQLSVELGIAPSTTRHDPPRSLQDGERRAMLGCIVVETLVSNALQVRPYFQASDIESVGLLATETIEEWEPWQTFGLGGDSKIHLNPVPGSTISSFNQFAELAGMLNDLNRVQRGHTLRLQQLAARLNRWRGNKAFLMSTNYEFCTPQVLNLHILTLSLAERLRIKLETDSSPLAFEVVHTDTAQLTSLVVSLLERQRPTWIPPTLIVYLRMLHNLLTQECQVASRELEQLRECIPRAQSMWAGCGCTGNAQLQTIWGKGTPSVKEGQQRPGATQPQDPRPLGMQASHSQFKMTPSIRPHNTNKSLPGGRGIGSTHNVETASFPANNQNIDTFTEALLEENSSQDTSHLLFDSLSTLDPQNWLAVPDGDFLRHLGVIGDTAANIQDYFDEDVG